jgi:hypothetical protein
MLDQLFPLGRIVITTNLQDRIQVANPESWEAEFQQMITRLEAENAPIRARDVVSV